MIKVNVLLLLVLLASGLALVYFQHEGRLLYTGLANENAVRGELMVDQRRLQQERQTLVTPARIEQYAQSLLAMSPATLGVTEYIPSDQRTRSGFVPQMPPHVQAQHLESPDVEGAAASGEGAQATQPQEAAHE